MTDLVAPPAPTADASVPEAQAAEAVRLCTMGCGRPADVRGKNGRVSGPCSDCRRAQSAADKAKAAAAAAPPAASEPKAAKPGRKPHKVAKKGLSPKKVAQLRKEFEHLLGKWAHVEAAAAADPDLGYKVGVVAAKQAEAMVAAQKADTMGRAVYLLREALRLAWTFVPPAGFSEELAAAEDAVEEIAETSDLSEAAKVVLCDARHDLAFAQEASNDAVLRLFAARRAGQLAEKAAGLHRKAVRQAEAATHQKWVESLGARAGVVREEVRDRRFRRGTRTEYRLSGGEEEAPRRRKKGGGRRSAGQDEILARTLAQGRQR